MIVARMSMLDASIAELEDEFDVKVKEVTALETELNKLREVQKEIRKNYPDLPATKKPADPSAAPPDPSAPPAKRTEQVMWVLENRVVQVGGKDQPGFTVEELADEMREEFGNSADPIGDWLKAARIGVMVLVRAKRVKKGFGGRYAKV